MWTSWTSLGVDNIRQGLIHVLTASSSWWTAVWWSSGIHRTSPGIPAPTRSGVQAGRPSGLEPWACTWWWYWGEACCWLLLHWPRSWCWPRHGAGNSGFGVLTLNKFPFSLRHSQSYSIAKEWRSVVLLYFFCNESRETLVVISLWYQLNSIIWWNAWGFTT